MTKVQLTTVFFFLLSGLMAQNVGINNTDPKAALDLNGGLRTRVLTLSVAGAAVTIPANKSFIWLEGSPAASFNITIDASYNGDAAKNILLSKKRATAVKLKLISMGIAANRLQTDGIGENEPVVDNVSEEGKAANRRVQFIKL